jgi:hypothetical protein
MGYTNYIENEPTFNDSQWELFTEAAKNLAGAAERKNAGLLDWFFNDDEIGFNSDGTETAVIYKNPEDKQWSLNFCKTFRREPDVYVKALYTLAKKFGTDVKVTCDGPMREYGSRYYSLAQRAYAKAQAARTVAV